MLTREQKKALVEELTNQIKEAKAVIFTNYRGLTVTDMTTLKKELKKEEANLKVYKKKLVNIALKNAGIKDLDVTQLEGQLAVTVSSQDEVIPAKILAKFSKSNENLKILGGLLGKEIMEAKQVSALAKLPSKEELLAKVVGSLSAPLTGLVNVLQGNQRNLVYALKAIADKKE